MTVTTRSQTNSKMITRATKKALNVALAPKKKLIKKSHTIHRLVEPVVVDTPRVTFLTQEEYNQQDYEKTLYGGYFNGYLIAAYIPELSSGDNFIPYRKYNNHLSAEPGQNYVVAPNGYYWDWDNVPYAGDVYYLKKLSKH